MLTTKATTKVTTKSSHFGWSLTGRSTASFAPLKYSFSKIGRDYKLKNQLLLVKSVSSPSSPEKEDGRVLRKLSLRLSFFEENWELNRCGLKHRSKCQDVNGNN